MELMKVNMNHTHTSNVQVDLQQKEEGTPLVNRLTENVLIVHDIVANKDVSVDLFHSSLTPEFQFWIKDCFVSLCGGWSNSTTQTLSARKGTVMIWKRALLRIGVWASECHPLTPMSQWTESHVKELLLDSLHNNIAWSDDIRVSKPASGPNNRGSIETVYNILVNSRRFKLRGKVTDGISFDFPKNFFENSLEDGLKIYKVSFDEWLSGGGYESIPLPVAMAMLSDAIATIEDKRTLFLKDYFTFQRSDQAITSDSLFNKRSFDRYCRGEWIKSSGKSRDRAKALKEVVSQHYGPEVNGFPIDTQKELSDHCADIYDACLVIILCLTGFRISEVSSICGDDYHIEPDGTWVVDSEILKTNYGISELREMHGLVAKAAQTMVDLSYVTKRGCPSKDKMPLFTRSYYYSDQKKNPRSKERCTSESGLYSRLNKFYMSFLLRHPELETHCTNIYPHRFRHTWAEFVLRRFEGNVFEAIRRHFRHSFGSYFTTHYTFNKLSDEVRDQIEKEYLKEILVKIATENAQAMNDENFKKDLHGKTVKLISQAMDSSIVTVEEVDDFVDVMMEDFESIVAHEYGYCLVRKSTRHLSKCVDQKTQTPVLQNGCFDKCSDCVHNVVSVDSNRDSIIRIAVSHTDMIESHRAIFGENIKSKAIAASERLVKRAGNILDKMGV
jgi:integrase